MIVHISLIRPAGRRLRRLRRVGAVLSLGMLAGVLLTACGSSRARSSAAGAASLGPHRGGTLVADIPTSPLDFDIDTTDDNESIWALDDMAETLYSNAANGHSVIPWLATGYTVSRDKLAWTFHLRHGVRFSDGRTMTARDVVWSITQAASPKDAANSYVDAAIRSVVAVDPFTVRITTSEPWAPLLSDLAMYANAIFPDHFLGESRSTFFSHPIGTGPFEMRSWRQGQYLKLVRNPYYWQAGKPYLDGLTLQTVADTNTRMVQLRGDEAQIAEQAPFALLSSLHSAGLRVGLFPSSRIDYVTMNEKLAPFKDPRVRLAVAEALNRAEIMKAVFFGHGTVADSPFMPILKYYTPVGLPAYDPARARAEMASSSYPHGFTVEFLAAAGDPIETPIAQVVASELAPLHIHVQIRQLDPSEVQAEEQSFHYGMRETYWTNDIVDPDEYTSFVLCGSGPRCGDVYANFTHFDDPEIDRLTLQGETTLSATRRAAIYARIQRLAAAREPMVWLGYSPFAYVYSPRVHGFHVYTQGNTHYENVWLSR